MTQPAAQPSLIDQAMNALTAAPQLQQQPDLAMAAAQSSTDPNQIAQNAQAIAGGSQQAAAQQVQDHAQQHGWLDNVTSWLGHVEHGVWNAVPAHQAITKVLDFGHYSDLPSQIRNPINAVAADVAKPVSTVAAWANQPLQDITHQYRYVRDMWVNHGAEQGLMAWLNPTPGHVDSSLGLGGSSNAQDSWQRTGMPGYTLDGNAVSPGRDIAGLFMGTHKGAAFNAVSGFIDGSFDLSADPTLAAGKVVKAYRAANFVLHSAADFVPMAQTALSKGPLLDPLARAIHDIANTDSATTIMNRYPTLRTLDRPTVNGQPGTMYRDALARADTPDKVVSVLNDAITSEGFQGTKGLPLYAFTRIPLRAMGDAMKNWQLDRGAVDDLVTTPGLHMQDATGIQKIQDRVARTVNAFGNHEQFTVDDSGHLTGTTFAPMDPRAADQVYTMVKYGNSERVARDIADQFTQAQSAGDLAGVHRLWFNSKLAAITGRGLPTDQQMLGKLEVDNEQMRQQVGVHEDTKYGQDQSTADISKVWTKDANGNDVQISVPLLTSQMGDLHTLNLMKLNRATRDNGWNLGDRISQVRKVGAMYGAFDDAMYSHVMSPIYRAMLVTGGFALRNSLTGEMLPRIMGDDGVQLIHRSAVKAVQKAIIRGDLATESRASRVADLASGVLKQNEAPGVVRGAVEATKIAMGASLDKAHVARLIDPLNSGFRDEVADLIVRKKGEALSPAASAGHGGAGQYAADLGPGLIDSIRSELSTRGARLNPDRWITWLHSDGIKPFARALSGHASLWGRDEGARLQAKAYLESLGETDFARRHADNEYTDFSDAQLRDAAAASHQAGIDWFHSDSPEAKLALQGIRRNTLMSTKDGSDPLVDWAVQKTRGLEGATYKTNGQPNIAMLHAIANFEDPKARAILAPDSLQRMGLEHLPGGAPGMEMVPNLSRLPERIAAFGFDHVLSPTINRLSREPIFLSHYYDELQLARTIPGLSEEEAKHMAEVRAVNRMIPEIHNPINRSQFQVAARNYIPFFFAREQSMNRLASALREDPTGWRKVQLAVHGMKDNGFTQPDPNTGKTVFTYPMSGEIGRYLPMILSKLGVDTTTGVPTSIGGTLQGLWPGGEDPNSPARLGVSPMVNVAMDGLKGMFPELTPIANAVTGPIAVDQPLWQQILPNAGARDAAQIFLGERDKTFANAMVETMQSAIANGDLPPSDQAQDSPAWDKWLGRIRNHTRINFAVRMLFGIGAPSSPILQIGDRTLTADFAAAIKKDGLALGSQNFLKAHPDATSYTVFRSASAGGTSISDTQKAWDWAVKNMDFINKNGAAASFFVPQPALNEPTSLGVYNDQLAAGLRSRKAPDEMLKEIMIQRGWNFYQTYRTAEQAQLAAAVNDPQTTSDIKHGFSQFLQNQLAPNNRLWWDDYNAMNVRKGDKDLLIKQVAGLLQTGNHPDSPMAPILTSLMGSWVNYQQQLSGISNPASTSYGMSTATDLKAQWAGYLDQVGKNYPTAAAAINRLFKGA